MELHVTAMKHNDTFYALFNKSMGECVCDIYPSITTKSQSSLEFYVTAWLTLFIFMTIVICVNLYVVYALQECTKFIQSEVDVLTKRVKGHRYWLSEAHMH